MRDSRRPLDHHKADTQAQRWSSGLELDLGARAGLPGSAQRQSRGDAILHSHAYLWGLPLDALSQAPIVHTLHITPEPDSARLWSAYPNACVTAVSRSQWSAFPQLRPAAVIPHGVDSTQFTLRGNPEDYVCYLGRFEAGKGPCQAIAAARAAGVRLLMAGPGSPYFREKVAPLIDGKSVEYVGFVKGAERNKLLGGAKALLFPIQYPEAFGLVVIEAMFCGTPVAAMRLGPVPELIEEGVNGYSVDSLADLTAAVHKCFALDRGRIRQSVEQKFSVSRMVTQYLALYESLISRGAFA
jgi:glycosyltransferase involved in cell wall biosynthesis